MVAFSHSEVYFLSNCQDVTSGLLQGCYCTTPCISSCSSILVAANPSLLKISLTSAMFSLFILGPGNCIWGIKISTEMPFRDPFAAINQKLPFQIIFFLFSLITFKFIPILSIRSVIILGGNVKYQEKQNKHKPKQTKNQNSVDFKIFSHF